MFPVRPGPFSNWLWSFALLWLCACGGPLERVDLGQQQAPSGNEPQALTVTLSGKLGTKELAHCTRALRVADENVTYVIFVLDAQAGDWEEDPDDLQSLFDRIQDPERRVGTVAYVRGRVTYGAAYLALLTDRTYFQRGAEMGEITKPERNIEEYFTEDPESEVSRRLDGVVETLTDRLARRKVRLRPDAEKMVVAMADPRQQLVRCVVRESGIERTRVLEDSELQALQASGATIVSQSEFLRPLYVSDVTAEEAGISLGSVDSFEQLVVDQLHVPQDAVAALTVNWAESMIGWLEMLEPFLLVVGFLLILFEVKTPGFGLPGVLGAGFLGLAMVYSYLTGLAEITEILVFFLGLAALAVEIFLLPGTLIFGAVGFLCLVLSLVLSRQSFVIPSTTAEENLLLANLTNLTVMFVLVLVIGYVLWRFLPTMPWVSRVMLKPPAGQPDAGSGARSGLGLRNESLTALVGRTGTAATVLHPTGTMELDGDRVDVVTEGEFVDPGTEVRVLYVQGNRVVVAAVEGPAGREGERGTVTVALLLATIGLILVVAEVFFVSFGVIAICAGVALISAVFFAFQVSTGFGVMMLLTEAIAAPIVFGLAFKFLPKTPFGRHLILSGPVTAGRGGAADARLGDMLGKTGQTLSNLRPAGFARIEGRKIDVVTRGEMIAEDTVVEVIDVTGNRVVVAAQKTP